MRLVRRDGKVSAHTPGPWLVSHDSDRDVVTQDGASTAVASIIGGDDFITRWPETAANARLVAAAPDLLSALANLRDEAQHFLDTDRGAYDLEDAIIAADAAIAKTEGKS